MSIASEQDSTLRGRIEDYIIDPIARCDPLANLVNATMAGLSKMSDVALLKLAEGISIIGGVHFPMQGTGIPERHQGVKTEATEQETSDRIV